MKIFKVIIIFLVFFSTAMADTTYTAKKLRKMINSGKYPVEGVEIETEKRDLDFILCKDYLMKYYSLTTPTHPVKILVDEEDSFMIKVWLYEGVVQSSCSLKDNIIIVKRSNYK